MNYSTRNKTQVLLGQNNNGLVWLIIANTVFFSLILFLKLVFFFAGSSAADFQTQIVTAFALPSQFSAFIKQPWSLLTFMVSDVSFWALLINMLWLWAFGFILQDLNGNKTIIPVYIYGGLVAAAAYLLCYNAVPGIINNTAVSRPLLGAGSSVMAVAIATTFTAPKYRLFPLLNGGIPIWVLTLIFCFINLGMTGNGPLIIANIASAAAGYFYVKQLNNGRNLGQWMFDFVDKIDGFFNPERKRDAVPLKEKLFYRKTKAPFEVKRTNQQRLDEILEKIHQKGIQQLTEEERNFLNRVSNEENL